MPFEKSLQEAIKKYNKLIYQNLHNSSQMLWNKNSIMRVITVNTYDLDIFFLGGGTLES